MDCGCMIPNGSLITYRTHHGPRSAVVVGCTTQSRARVGQPDPVTGLPVEAVYMVQSPTDYMTQGMAEVRSSDVLRLGGK